MGASIGLARQVSPGDVIHGLFQKHERMDIIAISMSLKGLSSLPCATYWYTHSLLASVLAMVLRTITIAVRHEHGE